MVSHQQIEYKDRIFTGVYCLCAAHLIVMMGRTEHTTLASLLHLDYYIALLIHYGIALFGAWMVRRITLLLDKQYPWLDDIWKRAILQLLFAVLLVTLACLFCVWIYYLVFDMDMVEAGYLDFEFPFSFALTLIFNLYYVIYYFYIQYIYEKARLALSPTEEDTFISLLSQKEMFYKECPVINGLNEGENPVQPKNENKEILIVDSIRWSTPIRTLDIAQFIIVEKTVFIRMKQMQSFNDCLQYDKFLNELSEYLDPNQFFRINRQCIVNVDCIGHYENHFEKSLLITLKPEIAPLKDLDAAIWKKLCTVSVDNVSRFKKWLNR